MILKFMLAVAFISLVFIVGILNFTSPSAIGPVGIFIFLGLIYVFSICAFALLLYGINKAINLLTKSFRKAETNVLKPKKISFFVKYALVLAFSPILLIIALQSSNSISLQNLILIIIIEAIGLFRVSKS